MDISNSQETRKAGMPVTAGEPTTAVRHARNSMGVCDSRRAFRTAVPMQQQVGYLQYIAGVLKQIL
jgi:hypothetical protein